MSVKAENVHDTWLPLITDSKSNKGSLHALDVGTGVGRDAAYLAKQGYDVVAVDKSGPMLEQSKLNFPNLGITWLQDALPNLAQVRKLNRKFDLILLSAIWMHIPVSQRQRCIRVLGSLLAPGGKLVITLRYGNFTDGRTAHPVSIDELRSLASQYGLTLSSQMDQISKLNERQADKLYRPNVYWETIVLTLPDDGSGAFPLLRNVVINDAKASTYKVALLRAILRVAEGHPGAIVQSKSTYATVAIPLGLVAMYWLKLYKPLLDTFNMPQNSNPNKGLGFVRETGWKQIESLSNNEFFVGAMFFNKKHLDDGSAVSVKAIHSTFLHITKTIKDMPAKYITLPGSDKRVFEVERTACKAPKESLVLDNDYLMSLGSLHVPVDIWRTLGDYSCWIEPALVNEWIRVMQSFELKTFRPFTLDQYHLALKWENHTRSTHKVQQRVAALRKTQELVCTWSKAKLSRKYDIDHTFPFARWPNNDLWNLVPTKPRVNRQKSDKLITEHRLENCRGEVLNFWKEAWGSEQSLFFNQANLSLPELTSTNEDFDSVFEALLTQRGRIKETQQLADW